MTWREIPTVSQAHSAQNMFRSIRFFAFCVTILASSSFISVNVVGAQTAPSSSSQPSNSKAVTLATVNIQNARIVSQEGNVFQISFDLTNRTIPQNAVKYAVMLMSAKNDSQSIVASRVYDEVLTLAEHSSVQKVIEYSAPTSLQGSFDLVLTSENANGFPFAISNVGKVELVASGGVEILADTCHLTIEGDTKKIQYSLYQGVDIAPEETLILNCDVQNRGGVLTVMPNFTTHHRTIYGKVVPHTNDETAMSVSFAPKEKKKISLKLPKAADPQAYDVVLTLGEGDTASNPIDIHYVLQGDSATIQNLSLDKNYYEKGETTRISLLWSPAADTFMGSRRYATATSAATSSLSEPGIASLLQGFSAKITLVDKKAIACAGPVTQPLRGSMVELSVPIIENCINPHLALDIVDAAGKVLAHQELVLISEQLGESSEEVQTKSGNTLWYLALLAALLILVGTGSVFYFKRHV